jgi:hypothetical protein
VINTSVVVLLLKEHELQLRENIPLNLVIGSDVAHSREISSGLRCGVVRILREHGDEARRFTAAIAVALLGPKVAWVSLLEFCDVGEVEEFFQRVWLLGSQDPANPDWIRNRVLGEGMFEENLFFFVYRITHAIRNRHKPHAKDRENNFEQ